MANYNCGVSFISRSGNLPARLVNRVTASQPQAVAVLRDKLEALYQADVASNSQEMSKIQKEGVDLWVALMKDKEARHPRVEEAAAREEEAAAREEQESMLEWSLVEKHFEDEISQSSSDMRSRLETSNISVRRGAELF